MILARPTLLTLLYPKDKLLFLGIDDEDRKQFCRSGFTVVRGCSM